MCERSKESLRQTALASGQTLQECLYSKEEYEILKAEFRKTNDSLEQVRSENQKKQRTIVDLQTKLRKQSSEQCYNKENENRQLQTLEGKLAQAKCTIDRKNAMIKEQKKKLQDLEQRIEDVPNKECEEAITAASQKSKKLQAELQRKEKLIQDLRTTIEENNKQQLEDTTRSSQEERHLSQARRQMRQKEEAIKALQNRLNIQQQELQEVSLKLSQNEECTQKLEWNFQNCGGQMSQVISVVVSFLLALIDQIKKQSSTTNITQSQDLEQERLVTEVIGLTKDDLNDLFTERVGSDCDNSLCRYANQTIEKMDLMLTKSGQVWDRQVLQRLTDVLQVQYQQAQTQLSSLVCQV
eukprot:TRINITY_DN23459_c0_g1_i13.p2 TRINITY_DN23459_c0_g1~~TRINITY_DN23459_c0_g1_i13.p2  ORF type:complete len:354 (+),score=47.13 TRINITY_DN23459_c0_g1_i13:1502-2563(+)